MCFAGLAGVRPHRPCTFSLYLDLDKPGGGLPHCAGDVRRRMGIETPGARIVEVVESKQY
jgi:hypothetical protein